MSANAACFAAVEAARQIDIIKFLKTGYLNNVGFVVFLPYNPIESLRRPEMKRTIRNRAAAGSTMPCRGAAAL